MSDVDAPAVEPSVARERLLDRCQDHLQTTGFGNASLREIAAGVGTSHRMLSYHFGSRTGLLTAIVLRVEEQQRDALRDLIAADGDLVDICRTFWHRISDPGLAPAVRLFFEIYSDALYARPWTDSFRTSTIAAWETPMTELFLRFGFAPEAATSRARLAIAVARGLLLDLLVTRDKTTIDAASDLFAELVSAPAH